MDKCETSLRKKYIKIMISEIKTCIKSSK